MITNGLALLALAGFAVELLAFREAQQLARGDGFRELGPGLAIIVFGPIQCLAVARLLLRFVDNVDMSSTEPEDRQRAQASRAEQVAPWTILPPALVVCVALLDNLLALHLPGVKALAGQVSVFWVPMWLGGLVTVFARMNRQEEESWLWLAMLYPMLAAVYLRL